MSCGGVVPERMFDLVHQTCKCDYHSRIQLLGKCLVGVGRCMQVRVVRVTTYKSLADLHDSGAGSVCMHTKTLQVPMSAAKYFSLIKT